MNFLLRKIGDLLDFRIKSVIFLWKIFKFNKILKYGYFSFFIGCSIYLKGFFVEVIYSLVFLGCIDKWMIIELVFCWIK